jgi:hypothetical protein
VALSRFGITGVISLCTLSITVTIDGSSISSNVVGQVLLPVFCLTLFFLQKGRLAFQVVVHVLKHAIVSIRVCCVN